MSYIGVDIVEIARIRQAIARWGNRFLRRVYTEKELELFQKHPSSLAARFAGKEAVVKALGTPTDRGFRWTDVEILAHPSGQPLVMLHGKAQRLHHKKGMGNILISLSHSRTHAIAMVSSGDHQKHPEISL